MQLVKHSLNLLESALGAGSLLVFVCNPLRPLPIRFLSAGATLVSVDIAKAGGPVARLRMFPNAGHASGNNAGNNSRGRLAQSKIFHSLVKEPKMDIHGRCRKLSCESGFDSLTVHSIDFE
jgi:hypothetical protein